MRSRRRTVVQVVHWQAADLRKRIDDAMTIYGAAMGYPRQVAMARAGTTTQHTRLPDFRAVAAISGRALVGFGYGYRSAAGQWWHDQVASAVPAETRTRWMTDCFELSELHVEPGWQGRGIGRSLITTLLDPRPAAHVLLSTPEGPTRALSLYRSIGFVDVLRGHLFPGDARPFAVLGLSIPTAADA